MVTVFLFLVDVDLFFSTEWQSVNLPPVLSMCILNNITVINTHPSPYIPLPFFLVDISNVNLCKAKTRKSCFFILKVVQKNAPPTGAEKCTHNKNEYNKNENNNIQVHSQARTRAHGRENTPEDTKPGS